MLLKHGINKHGQELYRNAFTGWVGTLGEAEFSASERRDKRLAQGKGAKREQNNRQGRGECFLQKVEMGRKARFILHLTPGAIARKKAVTQARIGVKL
ncbi:MAG: hypothetical protein ACK5JD_10800 [Mangrovibacterium sp.]